MRAARADEHRVAVRRGLGDHVRSGGPAGAGAVVDHECLAEALAQMLGDDAPDYISGSACGERHDKAHGLVRPLRMGNAGREQQRGQQRAQNG